MLRLVLFRHGQAVVGDDQETGGAAGGHLLHHRAEAVDVGFVQRRGGDGLQLCQSGAVSGEAEEVLCDIACKAGVGSGDRLTDTGQVIVINE